MVKVREVVPPTGTLTAPNALLMEGGPTTVTVAVAVSPVPPCVEETLPVTFTLVPAVVPLTSTWTMQLNKSDGMFPPVREMELEPATAVTVPLQLLIKPLGVATTRPAGRVSVKAKPVCEPKPTPMVMARLVEPFRTMEAAPKDLVMLGGGGPLTVRVAVAVPPMPVSVEETLPVTLTLVPVVVPFTSTWTPQVNVNPGMLPPVREMELEPATAVTVPLQLLIKPLGVATTRPAGRVSVKAKPVCEPTPMPMVKLRLVEPFRAMAAAPKDLKMLGEGDPTIRVAVAVLPMPPSVEETLPVMLTLVPPVVPVTLTEILQPNLPTKGGIRWWCRQSGKGMWNPAWQ